MKNLNIISNKIVEERVREYCRKIEENKLKNVKATIRIDKNKININNRKKLYTEKLRNEEIERNNNILKKKLEGINRREKKTIEQIRQISVQKMNTNKKNFLFENIKRAKIKKENKKTNHVNDISVKNLKKKIVYKGYIDDSKKNYKFYTEMKVDEGSNLSILSLNLKNKKVKKLLYNKEKHHELLNKLNTYEEIAKNTTLNDEESVDKIQRFILNKKKNEKKENEKPLRIKHRVMLENIEKTCDFYIKKYFNDDLEDSNFTMETNKVQGSIGSQNNDLLYLKKKKNSFLLMKNEILYKSKINEAQALLIFQKIKEKLRKNQFFLKSSANLGSFCTENNSTNYKKDLTGSNLIQNHVSKIKREDKKLQRNVSKNELKKRSTQTSYKNKTSEKEKENNLDKSNFNEGREKDIVNEEREDKDIKNKVENNLDKENLENGNIEMNLEENEVQNELNKETSKIKLNYDTMENNLNNDILEIDIDKDKIEIKSDKNSQNGKLENELEKSNIVNSILEDENMKYGKIEDDEIYDNKIEENKIENVILKNNEVENNEVYDNKIEENKIEDSKIEDNTVENNKVNDDKEDNIEEYNKVNDDKLEDSKLEDNKVEDDKVEDDKLEDSKLEDSKVKDDKVEYSKLEDDKVEYSKLEDSKVEDDKVREDKVENVEEIIPENGLEKNNLDKYVSKDN
ncbi:conserved Plasmodium protein, unknown function [Plasmodium relictum]|uniref:Uncharacterized protein n=1 Tax=Plasmodium relictum TaxID=85471 RepID=A0A1J1H5G5_PLARL|nr:conserved Plasmodium protein, unknown function [Plasmodium relictum]CRG99795.1 conserved Plasmodium protein, unknown function [Plasmodium relictum]